MSEKQFSVVRFSVLNSLCHFLLPDAASVFSCIRHLVRFSCWIGQPNCAVPCRCAMLIVENVPIYIFVEKTLKKKSLVVLSRECYKKSKRHIKEKIDKNFSF